MLLTLKTKGPIGMCDAQMTSEVVPLSGPIAAECATELWFLAALKLNMPFQSSLVAVHFSTGFAKMYLP